MTLHTESHPLAGKTVLLKLKLTDYRSGIIEGQGFRIEDWWDKLTGKSWGASAGNPAAMKYAIRAGVSGLPTDDKVVYGKIGGFDHLIHESELGEVVE